MKRLLALENLFHYDLEKGACGTGNDCVLKLSEIYEEHEDVYEAMLFQKVSPNQ